MARGASEPANWRSFTRRIGGLAQCLPPLCSERQESHLFPVADHIGLDLGERIGSPMLDDSISVDDDGSTGQFAMGAQQLDGLTQQLIGRHGVM